MQKNEGRLSDETRTSEKMLAKRMWWSLLAPVKSNTPSSPAIGTRLLWSTFLFLTHTRSFWDIENSHRCNMKLSVSFATALLSATASSAFSVGKPSCAGLIVSRSSRAGFPHNVCSGGSHRHSSTSIGMSAADFAKTQIESNEVSWKRLFFF